MVDIPVEDKMVVGGIGGTPKILVAIPASGCGAVVLVGAPYELIVTGRSEPALTAGNVFSRGGT